MKFLLGGTSSLHEVMCVSHENGAAMEPSFVLGIDPELARVLILVGLAATVGALLIAVAAMVISIQIALSVYRDGADAGCAGNREEPKRELIRSQLVA